MHIHKLYDVKKSIYYSPATRLRQTDEQFSIGARAISMRRRT
jgi:hypothetical protein